ncbi:hypothetical protein SLITO_v1c03810 [Spiroplasma litorale]|uniref:Uncharacterized protein n=1 Tax=Spiroplasma litorale TaxID=216942 RepID=A0A0K1W134_9MOLU|nr:hypothetical protein [Spiroplasma litorale]AKX34034.1 hypothetical protein SLITO_v1c03810 [Spiroplasma litorale]
MLGKYNFNKEQYKKFEVFFEEVLISLDELMNLIHKDLKVASIYRKSFDDVFDILKSMSFIDDFNNLKENFKIFYQDILNSLIVENKNRIVDRHIVLKFVEQAAEIIRISDLIAKISYENILSQKEVLEIDEIIYIIWEEIKKYMSKIDYYNKNYPKVFKENCKNKLFQLNSSKNLYDWENYINEILEDLEEYSLTDKDLHNIFIDGTSEYWYIVGVLNKILILVLLILTLLKKRKYIKNAEI